MASAIRRSRRDSTEANSGDQTDADARGIVDPPRSEIRIPSALARRRPAHCNSDTIARISPGEIVPCGPTRQKLESSFGKYGLSRREVNRTTTLAPFCKPCTRSRTSPPIEKATRVDSGKQHAGSRSQPASLRDARLRRCRARTPAVMARAVSAVAPLADRCYTETRPSAHGRAFAPSRPSDPARSRSARTHDAWRRIRRSIRSVDAYLEAHRGDFEEQLKALIRIPSVSAQPRSRRRHPPGGASSSATTCRDGARGRADRDQAAPDRLCRVARCAGQADAPGLRPLRRPARRAAGALALAPVRADRPRRQPLRPRGHRRQGPDVHPPEGGRGLAQDGRPAAGERQVPDRGRGGGRRGEPGGLRGREPPTGSPATTP